MGTSTSESTSSSSSTTRTLTELVPPLWCQPPSLGGVPGNCYTVFSRISTFAIAWSNLTLDSGILYFDGIFPQGDSGGGFMQARADSFGSEPVYESFLPGASTVPTPTQSAADGDFLYFINRSSSASYSIDVYQIST